MIVVLFVFICVFALTVGQLTMEAFERFLRPKWTKHLPPIKVATWVEFTGLAVLYLIVALFLNKLYPWAASPAAHESFRAIYLRPLPFVIRSLFYLSAMAVIAWRQRVTISGGAWMLVALLFLSTFAAFDWIMSLDPELHSTAFGAVVFITGVLFAFSMRLTRLPINVEELSDLNTVLLALIGTWTYLVFMEYLVHWSGNLPSEAHWYNLRDVPVWRTVALVIGVFQCGLIPTLFFRRLKRSLKATHLFALTTIICQILFIAWLVLPGGGHGL
jgi:hypothetical protein